MSSTPESTLHRCCARLMTALMLIALTPGAAITQEPSKSVADAPSFLPLFRQVGDFPLGAATSRLDYQSLDPATRRLYIAGMGAGRLLAFDIEHDNLAGSLNGFPKVTGVLAVPDLHKVYASVPGAGLIPSLSVALGMVGLSSGRGAIAIVDTRTLREITRLPGGVFPDGIAYDPKDRKIFVSDELGSGVLVIDADSNRLIARIAPGGEVGNVRYDPITAKVYAPIQSRNELAVIDPANLRLVARRPLLGGEHPHGLAIAPDGAFGYVACDGNDRLLTVDLATGKVLDSQPVAHDPDVLAVDQQARRLYVASESGNLSTFDISSAAKPHPLGDFFVGPDAHSVVVDPATHRLYFPLADVKGRSVLRVLVPAEGNRLAQPASRSSPK
jgi:DNA-binding beta-propeller fold protein YncE